MPYTAIATPNDGGEPQRVNVYGAEREEIYRLRNDCTFTCPDDECQATMFLRIPPEGSTRPHFYHKPSESLRSCLLRGGESADHIAAKDGIVNWIRRNPEYEGARVDLEVIMSNGNGLRRVADVYAELPDKSIHVFEAQLASQTVDEYQTREADYYILGADFVMWFVRKSYAIGPVGEYLNTRLLFGELEPGKERA